MTHVTASPRLPYEKRLVWRECPECGHAWPVQGEVWMGLLTFLDEDEAFTCPICGFRF